MPVAFMMGIPYEESFTVAELIGTKLFLNEFLAYEKLAELKNNRISGGDEVIDGVRQWISVSGPLFWLLKVLVCFKYASVASIFRTYAFSFTLLVVSVKGPIGSHVHVCSLWICQFQLIGHCDWRPVYV